MGRRDQRPAEDHAFARRHRHVELGAPRQVRQLAGRRRVAGRALEPGELVLEHRQHRLVDVARQHDRHVAGRVVALEERDHIAVRRILQVLDLADRRAPAVAVPGEHRLQERLFHAPTRVVDRPVLLLVDRLELGPEQPKHRVGVAGGLDARPLRQPVLRDLGDVDRRVPVGERVEPGDAEPRVQLIELVGDRERRRSLGLGVDLVQDLVAIGARRAQLTVERRDPIEVRLLLGVVERAELARALEQHVLEVVRQAGRLRRIVAAAGAHHDVRDHRRLLRVGAEVHGHAVGQPVDRRLRRIAGERRRDQRRRGDRLGPRRGDRDRRIARRCRRGGLCGRTHHRGFGLAGRATGRERGHTNQKGLPHAASNARCARAFNPRRRRGAGTRSRREPRRVGRTWA